MTTSILRQLFATACLLLPTIAAADDWPQWLGPNRDSVWRETGIVERFPDSGLQFAWRTPIGLGYSGPAVVGNRVFVTDYIKTAGTLANNPGGRTELQGQERVLCLDATSGAILWTHAYERSYRVSYASGPRATPTVQDGLVFALGAEGDLICLDAETGKKVWGKQLKQVYDVETPIWGFCGHPLVDGDKLICLVGGEGSVAVAFDMRTGRELWRALSASEPGYAPPIMIESAGRRQLLIWHADALNALDPDNGHVLWSQRLKPAYGMSIMAPRVSGNVLFASGIGNVGAAFQLTQDVPGADVLWRGTSRTGVYCSNSTPFIVDNTIFGNDCESGSLRAVDLQTGNRLWETMQPTTGGDRRARHATAFIVRHEDRFFLFNELGDLILARLTPQGYEELSRFHVLDPTNEAFGRPVVWSHPAFARQCLFARNDKEIVCVKLKIEN